MTCTGDSKWSTTNYHYYRDHEQSGAWGVRDSRSGRIVAIGMDKTDALMLALFLEGKTAEAVEVREDRAQFLARYSELDRSERWKTRK